MLDRASAAVLNGPARPSTPAATSDQRRPPNIPRIPPAPSPGAAPLAPGYAHNIDT